MLRGAARLFRDCVRVLQKSALKSVGYQARRLGNLPLGVSAVPVTQKCNITEFRATRIGATVLVCSGFRAWMALDPVTLRNVPKDFRLISGMTATAEIVIGKCTIISYLLDPIVRLFDESLREP